MSSTIKALCVRSGYTLVVAVVLTAFVFSAVAVPAQAGDWAGKVETVNGVKYVRNPAKPADGATTVDMEELWELGGETDDENEFFGVIADIEIDEAGNVYLLDETGLPTRLGPNETSGSICIAYHYAFWSGKEGTRLAKAWFERNFGITFREEERELIIHELAPAAR